jgi:hypothetical protein
MIIDVHSHLSTLEQWGPFFREAFAGVWGDDTGINLNSTPEQHINAMANVDRAIVFGINSIALKMSTPNDDIAAYARQHSDKIIGFMSIDPNDPYALEEIERCVGDLNLKGIKMSPVYQHYHPCDQKAAKVHRRAEELGLPILTHAAFHCIVNTPMEWANPILYDPVARQFPKLKIILAHVGLPWFTDAMVVARKNPNVFVDISGAFLRPWWAYQALATFQESSIMHKMLFGTDWPLITFEDTANGLRNVNEPIAGTGMPKIPEKEIEGILTRDSLDLLGLE